MMSIIIRKFCAQGESVCVALMTISDNQAFAK